MITITAECKNCGHVKTKKMLIHHSFKCPICKNLMYKKGETKNEPVDKDKDGLSKYYNSPGFHYY